MGGETAARLPEPERRLPEAAKRYWRTRYAGLTVAAALAALVVGQSLREAGVSGALSLLPLLLAVVGGALAATVLPGLRWRRWRFEIRDDEVDLRHGAFVVRRTLVPIRRVQHVDTESGPLQGTFDLATVTFHTAAGQTAIPALRRATAEDVRARVAALARTRDDT